MPSGRISREAGQYRVSSRMLLLFSAPFIVWQMGVLYFSGTAMSLFGRTPIEQSDGATAITVAAGYISSVLMIGLFPRKTVYMERALMPVALAATALMLLPLPAEAIRALFYVSAFVCVFSIGTMVSIAAQQFTVETTWRDGIISMALGGVLIAVFQNDIFRADFSAFTLFSLLLIAAQTIFYYLIPPDIEVSYAARRDRAGMPKLLFAGVWLVSGFATLLLCFASSFAESVPGGVSVIYLSGSAMAVLLYAVKKRMGPGSVRVFGVFFALSVFGFVLAFLSLHLPGLRLAACVLLGFVVALANLWIFFAALAFKIYPTRFIGAIGAAMGLVLAAFHSGLQEALRSDLTALYGIYAALSVALLLVYFFMEPYFIRMWRKYRQPQRQAAPAGGADGEEPRGDLAFGAFGALSEQERILAGLILDGHTESTAAAAMNIALNTQKSYRKNLYAKLDIHSRRELFELAEHERSLSEQK